MNAPGFWNALQSAEAKVVARVRAAIMAVGAGALAPALVLDDPHWIKPVGGAVFFFCSVFSVLLRAGEKNNEPPPRQPPQP